MDSEKNVDTLAKSLESHGIDPSYFVSYAPPAVDKVVGRLTAEDRRGEGRDLLENIAASLEGWHALGTDEWSPLAFCLDPMAEMAAGDVADFRSMWNRLDALIAALHEKGIREVTLLQKAIPSIHRHGDARAAVVIPALDMAVRLADSGIGPEHSLSMGVPALLDVVGTNGEAFTVGLDAIESFVRKADDRGMGGYYPIFVGIEAMARVYAGDIDLFIEALDDLWELCLSLKEHDISPYRIVEYGLSAAFEAAVDASRLSSLIFPLALPLASQGVNPGEMLEQGVISLVGLSDEAFVHTADLLLTAVGDGVDPGSFLAHTLPYLSHLAAERGIPTDDLTELIGECLGLTQALRGDQFQPFLTFQYALPHLFEVPEIDASRFRSALILAGELARFGRDPGPVLDYGYVPALDAAIPAGVDENAILETAMELTRRGYNPRSILGDGVPVLVKVAGGDPAGFSIRLRRLADLQISLENRGVDPRSMFGVGIRNLAGNVKGEPELFDSFLDEIDNLVGTLTSHGIDPSASLHYGVPRIAESLRHFPGLTHEVFRFAGSMAESGLDPGEMLSSGLGDLIDRLSAHLDKFQGLLLRLEETISLIGSTGMTVETPAERFLSLVSAAAGDDEEAYQLVFERLQYLLARGIDGTTALAYGFPALLELGLPRERMVAELDGLQEFLLRASEAGISVRPAAEHALPVVFGYTATKPAARGLLYDLLFDLLKRGAKDDGWDPLFQYGAAAAAQVTRNPREFVEILQSTAPAEGGVSPAWRWALVGAAMVAAENATGRPREYDTLFRSAVDLASEVLGLPNPDQDLFYRFVRLSSLAAGSQAAEFDVALNDWSRLLAGGALAGFEKAVVDQIGPLEALLGENPTLWHDLLLPTLISHGRRSLPLLSGYVQVQKHLVDKPAVDLLRKIVSGKGVRALELVDGLIVEGVWSGVIESLGVESALIEGFIEEFPFPFPEAYERYRAIYRDESQTDAQKTAAVHVIKESFTGLVDAVISGDLTPEQESDSHLPIVLYHVFPPAASVPRESYGWLFDRFSDHPEHTAVWPGADDAIPMKLSVGSYRVRGDATIDRGPWEFVREALSSISAPEESSDPEDHLRVLGEKLFSRWIEGTLGREAPRRELLAEIYGYYRRFHPSLPDGLSEAVDLLKYREFLTDSAREIILAALEAYRGRDPERYIRQTRNKLAPPRRVGKGLVKSVAATVRAARSGALDREDALGRLSRQLDGFAYETLLERFFDTEEPDIPVLLSELTPVLTEVELGDEHNRILGDLVGGEIAGMEMELFGGGGKKGKLEYTQFGEATRTVRFVTTKRRAHAPVGYCEGVCTATDRELWDTLTFFQAVIWGEERRALGGVHLLVVDEDDRRYLLLPGINPSLSLIKEAGAEEAVDAVLRFAASLARRWGLAGVWIPANLSIASNRGPVAGVIQGRGYRLRHITRTPFSYSPYAYTIDSVLVVEEFSE